jgi:hypothetical protein
MWKENLNSFMSTKDENICLGTVSSIAPELYIFVTLFPDFVI